MPRVLLSSLLVVCSGLCAQTDSRFHIITVAGTGSPGFSGDGGPATSAQFGKLCGMAIDTAGNLYIADTENSRMRRVTPAGIITTVAGNGLLGFSGDGGPATSAQLSGPSGVASDASGNLYIADRDNHRIRKVTPAGIITTVAGNGLLGFSGDGGPATSAQLAYPNSVAVDTAGNLYIPDGNNFRIRKVTPGGIITTVAGDGKGDFTGDGGPATSAGLGDSTWGVAVDTVGNLYVATHGEWFRGNPRANCRIRKVAPGGLITTVAGNGTCGFAGDGGPATSAQFNSGYPTGLAVDTVGTLYISDLYNHRIRKVTPPGIITTVAGNGLRGFSGDGGPATSAQLSSPSGIAVDPSDNLWVADSSNFRIRRLISTQFTVGCLYSTDQDSQHFGTPGGRGSVAVLTDKASCAWSAASLAGWITITSGASGSGNGIVNYSVAPNDSSTSRKGTLAIAGRTFTVSQPGVVCSWSIDPRSISVPGDGAIGNAISVTTNAPDCGWTARSNVGWIFVTSGTNGIGNGTVNYTVGMNTGGFRTGTITIAGQTFTVTQAPQGVLVPVISTNGVINAASGIGGAVAPGEFISIYGAGIGPPEPIVSMSLERGLGYTRVFLDGVEAFLTYVSVGQVNALVPYGIAGRQDTKLQIEYQAVRSNAVTLPLAGAAPGIFTVNRSGTGAAVAVNEDGRFNSDGNAAPRGSIVAFWATGQGQTDPPGMDGKQPEPPMFPKPALPVSVAVGGVGVAPEDIFFAGLIYAGVMQVNVKIPDAVTAGNAVELLLTVGKSTGRKGVTLSVR